MKKRIYLDHNATTPLHPEVKKVMQEAMDVFGNPSSLHSFGREARKLVEDAREKVADFVGASSEEVIFVGSGSEANNTALSFTTCSSRHCMFGNVGNGIITTNIEHPCILETSKCLKNKGQNVNLLGVDKYGKVDPQELKVQLKENIGLVSIMMANNEIGTIQDIKELASLTHDNNALFHTDAVQAVGKIPVNVKDLNVDFLTMSAHKMYGPKGIAALYIKKGTPFCQLIRGGHQEKGRRAGTENTIGIVGLAAACEMRKREMAAEEKRLLKLKDFIKQGIEKNIEDINFNGHPTDCLPGTLNVSFEGAEGEAVLLYLDIEGIAVSTGSACASGSLDPSHVLLATGIPIEKAHGSIRISLGRENTKEDAEFCLDALIKTIARVRQISTAYH